MLIPLNHAPVEGMRPSDPWSTPVIQCLMVVGMDICLEPHGRPTGKVGWSVRDTLGESSLKRWTSRCYARGVDHTPETLCFFTRTEPRQVDVDPEDETRLTDGGREVVTGEADWTGSALRRFMVIVGQCNHG